MFKTKLSVKYSKAINTKHKAFLAMYKLFYNGHTKFIN